MENRRERVLIADDEKEIRDILRLLLTQEGYQVAEAENGKEAVDKADEGIQLYILDVNMPVMSGFAAAMEIRKHSDAPVMFLTAYSGEADMTIGFSSGADDYLVKPFSNVELLLRVRAQEKAGGRRKNRQGRSKKVRKLEQARPPEIFFTTRICSWIWIVSRSGETGNGSC